MDCDCTESCQLADRFTPATRELMVFTKSKKRYFDLDAVREGLSEHSRKYYVKGAPYLERLQADESRHAAKGKTPLRADGGFMQSAAVHPGGVPPLDWWQIPSPKPQPITEYQGDEMTATFYVGDAIETMNKLPEKSVDLILTSPPFLALRSYLPADHPDKALEGGSQATPGEYIDWLVDVVEACARVLAPHGSLCIELGDTYAGGGTGLANYSDERGNPDGMRDTTFSGGNTKTGGGTGWPLAKSLSLIPELFRLTLVYGFNPLTGRTTDRWRLRNVVRWVRPNPPVGALGDKFRPATSELMVFCKSAKRFFDLDAVRGMEPEKPHGGWPISDKYINAGLDSGSRQTRIHENGAPPLDWWNIPPGGFSGAHYAVFPPELCVKPIKAMCPEKVCRQCGEPSRRIAETTNAVGVGFDRLSRRDLAETTAGAVVNGARQGNKTLQQPNEAERVTLGWTDCGHDDCRPGLVLDPFGGSGTTALVATGHGRDCILIDLDERNYDLALERVGPFILTLGNVDE